MTDRIVSPDRTLSIEGIHVPRILYGTAWKEDATQRLTELALAQGFRGIDTANQRRHYHEAAVGQGHRGVDHEWPDRPGRFVFADQVHLPSRAGQPAALRSRRTNRDSGRAIAGQLARAFENQYD